MDAVLRVVAVLGLITILLLGAWGIVQLAESGAVGHLFVQGPATGKQFRVCGTGGMCEWSDTYVKDAYGCVTVNSEQFCGTYSIYKI
jgi:hypothetical protein